MNLSKNELLTIFGIVLITTLIGIVWSLRPQNKIIETSNSQLQSKKDTDDNTNSSISHTGLKDVNHKLSMGKNIEQQSPLEVESSQSHISEPEQKVLNITPQQAMDASIQASKIAQAAKINSELEIKNLNFEESDLEGIKSLTNELIEQIWQDAQDGQLSENAKDLLKELTEKDVDVVSLLAKTYKIPGDGKAAYVPRNSIIIKALKELGSEEAKAELLDIALRSQQDSRTLGPRAAKAFITLAADTSEMVQLLSSTEPQVRNITVEAMHGLPLTPEATEAIGKLLSSKSWVTHNLVASTFGADKSSLTATMKVNLLLQASVNIEKLISNKEPVPAVLQWTAPEMVRASNISALASMPGATNILRQNLSFAKPQQREMLVIALGMRKQSDVRPEILKIIGTTIDGFTRTMAVDSLYYIATEDDIPLLRTLTTSDSFKRPTTLHSHKGREKPPNADFPVRYTAERVLAKLQSENEVK